MGTEFRTRLRLRIVSIWNFSAIINKYGGFTKIKQKIFSFPVIKNKFYYFYNSNDLSVGEWIKVVIGILYTAPVKII